MNVKLYIVLDYIRL